MASFTTVTVDAEGVLASWLNSLTMTLVGATHPFRGFFFEGQRSPGSGTYGWLTRIAGVDAWSVEAPADMARMSCSIFSTTKKAAADAAVAYANTLRTLSVVQPVIGTTRIRLAGNLSGPLWIPNVAKNAPQYLVDADVYFTPTT
jgi:hypothetical protein